MRSFLTSLLMVLVLNQVYHASAIFCRDANCLSCSQNQWTCDKCKDPYVLKNGTCLACSEAFPFCIDCVNGWCRSCSQGYNVNSDSCCPENCKNCANGDCYTCKDEFGYKDKTCQQGACSEANCDTCGKNGCFNCKPGFVLFEKKCLPGSCSDYYPHCSSCYRWYASQNGCIRCQDGYFLNETVKNGYIDNTLPFPCLSCAETFDPLCIKCNQDMCHDCQKGYHYESKLKKCCPDNCDICEKSGCKACANHFFYQNETCKAGSCSDTNCAQCGNKGCYICYDGFILANGVCKAGNCSSIYPNCKSCNVEGCTSCEGDYWFNYQNRKCESTKSGNSISIPPWVGVIYWFAAVGLIGFLISKCRRRDTGNAEYHDPQTVKRRYYIVEEY